MKTFIASFLLFFVFFGCVNNSFEADKLAVTEVMDKQMESWNNGDIKGFMEGYWQSDSLRFLGKRGLTKGWQTTLDNYLKSYPDRQAMGKLIFTHLSFEPLNSKQMFVVGKWTLEREKDTLAGHYSLVWQKFDKDWKIIFDHTN